MAEAVKFGQARHITGSVTIGFLVIVLYVFFVLLVFFGFATYIVRIDWDARIQNAAASGGGINDLDSVFHLVQREAELKSLIARRQADVRAIDAEMDKFAAAKAGIEPQQRALDARTQAVLMQIRFALAGVEPGPQARYVDELVQVIDGDAGMTTARLRKVAAIFQAMPVVGEGADPLGAWSEIAGLLREHAEIEGERADLERALSEADTGWARQSEERSLPRKEIEQYEAELRAVSLPANSEHRATMSALRLPLVQHMVRYPTIFLTLIVTIAAGGLGAVVSFTRNFFAAGKDIGGAQLFVGVGEGIAAAIAIFLFSGAGMLVLTQGGGADGKVELSPFTVAFVAFLSGFMADQAFLAIQRAGQRIFNPEEADRRDRRPPAAEPEPEPGP